MKQNSNEQINIPIASIQTHKKVGGIFVSAMSFN